MPMCMLGGDDLLCGLTVGETQWNQLSEIGSQLLTEKKISECTQILGVAVHDKVLDQQLFLAVNRAIERLPAAKAGEERGKDFVSDVLDVSEEFAYEKPQDDVESWAPKSGTQPKVQLST